MSINVITYNKVSELSGITERIIKNFAGHEKNLRFIVPSRKDKYWHHDKSISNTHDLWTWNEIYEDICSSSDSKRKRVLSPPDHLLILKSILDDVLNALPDKASSWPGLKRSGFPSVLSGDIRDLLNEAVPHEKLISNPDADNPSEFLLPEVYKSYLEYLAKYDLIDSAQICTSALDALRNFQDWGKELILVFEGFLSFNHSQLELVRGLSDRCREVIIIKPEVSMKKFHDANYQMNVGSEPHKSSGHVIELKCAEPGLEPDVIARTLALWSQGEYTHDNEFSDFDSIGIMIESGREESFAQAFRRYGIPYNFESGIKINLTLPGIILSSIRHLESRNFPTYDTAMLLSQSCFAGINFPVMKLYRAGCYGLESWKKYLSEHEEEHETFHVALRAVEEIQIFCRVLSHQHRPLEIMRAFEKFLTAKNLWLDRISMTPEYPGMDEAIRITASAIQTVREKVNALEELTPDLGNIQDRRISKEDAYEYLDDWCKNSYTRAPIKISNAVRIFTGNPPVLSSFPVWIITGVTQKTWSGNIKASPLLGNEERRKINANDSYLPLTSDEASQHEALFRRLIHTGERITLISCPELDNEGRPVSESPFMNRFKEDFKDTWQITRADTAGINILLGSDNFTFRGIDAEEKISRCAPVVKRKSEAVGASDIHDLLNCPFLWWQKRQAKLYERDSDITSPAEWGNMIHAYWESVWKEYRMNMKALGRIFVDIAQKEWQRLIDSEKLEEENDYSQYRKLLRDSRLKRHLEGVRFRVERLRDIQACIIDSLHESGYVHKKILLEDEAHLKSDIDGITFLGQCDRIEIMKSPDGEDIAFIADYKEGSSKNSEKAMTIENYSWNAEHIKKFEHGLQLSVYAALFERMMNCTLSGVYILGLEDGKIAGSFSENSAGIFEPYKAKDFSAKKFKGGISERSLEGEYAMTCAAGILNAGKFEPEYNNADCRYCRIKSICRKGEIRGDNLLMEDEENSQEED
ncbi:MAG: PD-(D/E)XK nuclease family protein [Synergistaceae bacterium]|nr:PD-(D/E)XK nuclease family protein [Synergistaceae bacterium]